MHMLLFKRLKNDSHPNPIQFQSITFLVRMILGQCPLGAYLPSTRHPERIVVASLDHYGSNQVRLRPIPRRATCFLTRGAAHYLVRATSEINYPDIVPRRWVIYFSFRKHVRQCITYTFNKAFQYHHFFQSQYVSHAFNNHISIFHIVCNYPQFIYRNYGISKSIIHTYTIYNSQYKYIKC